MSDDEDDIRRPLVSPANHKKMNTLGRHRVILTAPKSYKLGASTNSSQLFPICSTPRKRWMMPFSETLSDVTEKSEESLTALTEDSVESGTSPVTFNKDAPFQIMTL